MSGRFGRHAGCFDALRLRPQSRFGIFVPTVHKTAVHYDGRRVVAYDRDFRCRAVRHHVQHRYGGVGRKVNVPQHVATLVEGASEWHRHELQVREDPLPLVWRATKRGSSAARYELPQRSVAVYVR